MRLRLKENPNVKVVLSEAEKQQDRVWAEKVLKIVEEG